MSYIDSYLGTLNSSELKESVVKTSNELILNISSRFTFTSQLNCLLLGNVQSGKTGQMLGAISLLADKGYRLFLLLTTDNIDLQRQTYNRVKNHYKILTLYQKRKKLYLNRYDSQSQLLLF